MQFPKLAPRSLDRHIPVPYVTSPQSFITPSEYPRRGTIAKLSNEALLNIFHYYLDASPRFWPTLIHICRKWRHIVFASQQTLHLRLFCKHGTPVLKTLDCWPALPIVVQYGAHSAPHPPAPEDEDNIMAALKRSERVISIGLAVTTSLLERLSSIERPFSELEDLVLLSRYGVSLTLPSAFQWGPRLRTLHLTRTAIPTLPVLLSLSTDLVDLQLHEVPDSGYISPVAFANALSRKTHLRSLSLHFLSSILPTNHNLLPPRPVEMVVLPALTCLKYQGTDTYLEDFVARIDAPRLRDIDILFFGRTMRTYELCPFISRTKLWTSPRRVAILFSKHTISITVTQPEALAHLELKISCQSLARQLSYMSVICMRLHTFLLGAEHLRICATGPANGQVYINREAWRKIMRTFTGAKWVHVAGEHSTNIISEMRCETVLPALYKLCTREPEPRQAPFQDAVVSLIHSRHISGQFIGVEYERLWSNELRGTETLSHQVTIEMLCDDILLNIFLHYLRVSPQVWYTLTHVCQKWRQTVLASPLGLHLRLYCTYGTPVLSTLAYWPPLPLVVNYGGYPKLDPPAPEDEENIMAALMQSDRVISISFTVTGSLLENISKITEPFLELEELALMSRDNVQLTLPNAFRWGPRLRTLRSTGIAIPALPQLLSPSTGLVDLQLHEIPTVGYFPPDAFANALAEMTQLETLSLHFLSLPPRRNIVGLPLPSWERVVLPSLTCLKYRGTSKYLDSFVARIDAPRLRDIDIIFFSQPTMDASELGRFIERIELWTSISQVDVQISADAISISIAIPNPSTSTSLRLEIPCKQLDWQLSSMTQICTDLSSILFRVENLRISSPQSPDSMPGEQWPGLIRPFGSAKNFRLDGILVLDILSALRPADGEPTSDITVLPSLRNLLVPERMQVYDPLWDAVQSFTASWLLSGHPINSELYLSCHLCSRHFTWPQDLKRHLVDHHSYGILCSYCGNFECKPGYNDVFREHLASKHAEVTRPDLGAPEIFGPFTKVVSWLNLIYLKQGTLAWNRSVVDEKSLILG